jgi:hypothetical protein
MFSFVGTNYTAILGVLSGVGMISNHNGSGASYGIPIASLPAGLVRLVHISRPASFDIYINGVKATLTNSFDYWGKPASGNHSIGNRQNGSSPQFFNKSISDLNAWNRELSDIEIKSLSDNPYQILEPITETIWVPDAVSGGGGTTDTLTSQPITTSAPTLTQAALGQTHALTSQAIATAAPTVTQSALGQVHALSSQSISTAAPTITAPALTAASNVDNLIALALSTGAITITQAVLAQHHVLVAQGIDTAAPTISQPAIGQVHGLSVQAISTGAPTISQPSLTAAANVNALTAQDITAGSPTISTPGIAQIHVLLGQAVVTGAPTVTRAVLVGDPVDFTPSVYQAVSPAQSYTVTVQPQTYIA